MKNRTRYDIYRTMLDACRLGLGITSLIQKTNSTFTETKKYAQELEALNMLSIGEQYHTTPKGLAYIQTYDAFLEFLRSDAAPGLNLIEARPEGYW